MTRCIFLGPSLPIAQARAICDGVYLPPARQGDILLALRDHQPHAIALIDGFFEQVPAVWHKEILWALRQGVVVVGGSSMGALRAAELSQFGMVGVGKIFEAYRSGCFPPFDQELFEDDDEVAVVHGPQETNYAGTVAMVDIRTSLAAAENQGVITTACRDHLAILAKGLFYKQRTYKALLDLGRGSGEFLGEVERLSGWLMQGAVSQKAADAVELLRFLSQDNLKAPIPDFRFEHSSVWEEALMALETPPGPTEGDG